MLEKGNQNEEANKRKNSMAIEYHEGSIFDSKADVLVNPVNTVGVMGAGLAKQFKERYPKMFDYYKAFCDVGGFDEPIKVELYAKPYLDGIVKRKYTQFSLHWWFTEISEDGPLIINAPTKRHWKEPSTLHGIRCVLLDIQSFLFWTNFHGMRDSRVAMPRLGCGLGGLDWEDVNPLVKEFFGANEWRSYHRKDTPIIEVWSLPGE